MNIVSVWHNVE